MDSETGAPETVDELVEIMGYFITDASGFDLNGAVSWWASVPLKVGTYSTTEALLKKYRKSERRAKFVEVELLGESSQRRWEMRTEAPSQGEFIGETEVDCSCWVYDAGIVKIGGGFPETEVDCPKRVARAGVPVVVILDLDPDGNRTGRIAHARCHPFPRSTVL
jgi:hypothetical protein